MVRATLIEDPSTDDALAGVQAKLTTGIVEVIHVVYNSDPSGLPSARHDIVWALQKIATQIGSTPLEGIDFVGHGAPGTIRMGATAANANKVRTSDQTQDWAMLDSDVNKFDALMAAAELLRSWRNSGRLAPGFQVRLIGCNTAVDPGMVPDGLLNTLQDGAAFIHLLASFFDCEVAGTLGYIGPEAFNSDGFKDTSVLRSCLCGSTNGAVTFNPATIDTTVGSDTKVGSLGVNKATQKADPKLKELLEFYQADAIELKTKLPLVIRDESITVDGVRVDLVEEGKAILIKSGGKLYRAKARPEAVGAAQQATLDYLFRAGGSGKKAPLWADRTARPIESQRPGPNDINRGRRPAPRGAP